MANEQRWYRQWWLWFVVAIPLIGVISGTSLVIIASSGHDALVVDDYYKKGKAINLSFARQERAVALGLRFELSMDGHSLALRQLAGPKLNAARLHLYHPTLAERDHHLQLTADGGGVLHCAQGSGVVFQTLHSLKATGWAGVLFYRLKPEFQKA